MNTQTGIVFNIQKYTVHDGPGIRTEVFLKGCTLDCLWCSNPESISQKKQVGFYKDKCIGLSACGDCVDACPESDVFKIEDNKIVGIDRLKCTDCMNCADVCPTASIKRWGSKMNVDEVMKEVISDKAFYDKSGGGITISGGEALMQPAFAEAILKECKNENINTCFQSAMHVPAESLKRVIPYTDLIIADIKHMDRDMHKDQVGVHNDLILENLRTAAAAKKDMIIRIPVIPGFNDNHKDIERIGAFIQDELSEVVKQIQLLRYRPLGLEKYDSLDISYRYSEGEGIVVKEFDQRIDEYVDILRNMNLPAVAGSTTKIEL